MRTSTAGDGAIGAMLDDLVCGFHGADLGGQGAGLAGHLTARRPANGSCGDTGSGSSSARWTRRTLVQADSISAPSPARAA